MSAETREEDAPDRWEIPTNWVWSTMGEIADVVGGGTPKTSDPQNFGGDIPWITPADLSGYRAKTISRGERNISQTGLDGSGAQLMPAGTVLFSSRAPIGYVAIASNPVTTNQGFKSFVLRADLSPDYVYYYLQRAKELAVARASGTTFLEISGAKARTIPIPVAPRAEQHRIVAELEKQLTRLDAGVEALKRVQAKLKRYRASVLKAACEGRLVPTEAELARREKRDYEPADKLLERILKERRARWEAAQLAKMKANAKAPKDDRWKANYIDPAEPDEARLSSLPEGWVWTTTEVVGDVLLGRQRAPQYLTGKHSRPYLRVANIKDDRIDFSDIESMDFDADHFAKYRLVDGDILLSEGQSLELVGQSAIYRGGIADLCFQKTLHRFRAVGSGPSPEFAQVVFRSHVRTGLFKRLASITTNIAHLTLEKLVSAPFPLPPRAEQGRIAAEVAAKMSIADATDAAIKASLRRASSLRKAILQRAFDGSLVPQDPKERPAAAPLESMTINNASSRGRHQVERPLAAPRRKATA